MNDCDFKSAFNSLPSWLLIAAFSFTSGIGRALAADEAQPAESVKAASPKLPERITTLDGKTYDKVTVEKVDPDGLLVSFAPAPGGSGTAKLKFRNLPPELRKQFGYDPARATDYESARAQGDAIWRAENVAWMEQRRAAQEEQADREKEMRAQAEARLASKAEQAPPDAANSGQEPAYYYSGYWWPGNYNSTLRDQQRPSQRNHIHQNTPAAGNRSSPISPHMGPMRPSGK